ncbi:MAG: hypothetical protein KDJ19_12930 [Hyphomicrobiaceae bacterium]|nr:hypothetical protein [Hyphomicrobiaceae bacterium]MCC0024973.1 hypothetical protein [Hyphomicrobiaceae bacterium]
MARSKFAATLLDLLDDVSVRRVPLNAPDDPVYKLRYKSYRAEDFVHESPEERLFDQHDLAPNVYCFGVYLKQDLVSAVRFQVVTPDQPSSVSRTIFPRELGELLGRGGRYIDPSRFVTDPDLRLSLPALPFITLRVVAMACEHFDVDYCVSSVRPEHAAFYRRVFDSHRVEGSEGYYPGIQFAMHLYIARVARIRDRVAIRFPFFMSTHEERVQLFDQNAEIGIQHLVKPTAHAAQYDDNEKPAPVPGAKPEDSDPS